METEHAYLIFLQKNETEFRIVMRALYEYFLLIILKEFHIVVHIYVDNILARYIDTLVNCKFHQ